jgi:hypothetical protein
MNHDISDEEDNNSNDDDALKKNLRFENKDFENRINGFGNRVYNSKNSIYDKLFASSRMAGNIGALDATTTTWFGANVEYVHGINM